MTNQNRQRLEALTAILLDDTLPAYTLRPEVIEIRDILEAACGDFQRTDDITANETRTDEGLAVSPTVAAMCTDDYTRTIVYLRGLHAAIRDTRDQNKKSSVRVLYVGTGPYAILAVPLMTIWASKQLCFDILDIHEESIMAVKTIVEYFDLTPHVSSFICMDAMMYQPDKANTPDIIIAEIMLAGLENEPQVAVTRSLIDKMPDALFLPEAIEISAYLEAPDHHLGSVFNFDREMFQQGVNQAGHLPASTLHIPEYSEPKSGHNKALKKIFLQTRVQVYRPHTLEPDQSGLTTRRRLNCDFEWGQPLDLAYQMGKHPGLIKAS